MRHGLRVTLIGLVALLASPSFAQRGGSPGAGSEAELVKEAAHPRRLSLHLIGRMAGVNLGALPGEKGLWDVGPTAIPLKGRTLPRTSDCSLPIPGDPQIHFSHPNRSSAKCHFSLGRELFLPIVYNTEGNRTRGVSLRLLPGASQRRMVLSFSTCRNFAGYTF